MANYQQYAEYKDSGVEWLGEIPSHWEVKPLKYLIKGVRGAVKAGPFGSHLKNSDMQDEDVKVVTQQNVISNDIHVGNSFISFKKYRELQTFKIFKNDLLITTRGTIGRTYVYDTDETAILHPCLIRIQLDKAKVDTHFVSLIIQESGYALEQILVNSNATTIEVIYSDNLINTILAIPNSLEEQIKILNYIKCKKYEIDTLIEKQQTLIRLLQEKRQAVISHAVTKGLNPDAPMKDSGVEWLGEVPEHWDVGRLKNVLRIRNGRDYKTVEVESGGYPVYGSGGVFRRSSQYLFDGVSVLFGRKGTINKPLLVSGKFWTVDTMFYSEVFSNAMPEYIYNQALLFPFDMLSTNTALPSMTQEDLLELGFVIPPFEEQESICKYLYEKLETFSNLVNKAQKAIELMQERRTALISAAVTGKIDVRDWVAEQ